jgi:glucose/arabinose dehydrogenase
VSNLFRIVAAVLLLTGTTAGGSDPYEPGTYRLTPQIDLHLQPVPVDIAPRFSTAFAPGTTLNLPPGFEVNVFASAAGLGYPRELVMGPDSVLYVADASGGGQRDSKGSRVLALPDRDGDGIVDEIVVVADSLSMCYSIDFHDGELYAAETHQVVKLLDLDGDGFRETHVVVVPDIPNVPPGAFHTSRNMIIDAANNRLFVQVGSPCDLCRQEEAVIGYTTKPLPRNPEFGTILVANLDGSGRRVWASGIRNVVGLDLHPDTGELWATHNHLDLMGSELPPEWIDVVRDGDFMGYPLVYGWRAWVDFTLAEYQKILPITPADSLMVATHKRPAALVNAHLAPMAIHFYRGELLPPEYHHAGFVAIRGGRTSGNLATVPGFKVIALFGSPDGSDTRIADFLTGFYDGDNVRGKPVGIAEDGQGNLYVSTNNAAAIYRISFSPLLATWEHNLPESVRSGATLDIAGTVRILRLGEGAGAPEVSLDLSGLGGPVSVPLVAVGDSSYQFAAQVVVNVPNGLHEVQVRILQGQYSNRLVGGVAVLPTADVVALVDGPEPGWHFEHSTFATVVPRQQAVVFAGQEATAITGTSSGIAGWRAELVASEPVPTGGYESLRFAFHPGSAEFDGRSLSLAINNPSQSLENGRGYGQFQLPSVPVDLLAPRPDGRLWLDVEQQAWQIVDIPLEMMRVVEPMERVRLFGNTRGTFYIDEMRLVTPAAPSITAVGDTPVPLAFDLGQNYPNPFNSSSVIPFRTSIDGDVRLEIFDIMGRRVVALLADFLPAGSHRATWDGRDDKGHPVASGVYVYRLQAPTPDGWIQATHKLALMR